jgi:hypothetical protein
MLIRNDAVEHRRNAVAALPKQLLSSARWILFRSLFGVPMFQPTREVILSEVKAAKVGGTKSMDPVQLPLQLTAKMDSAGVSYWSTALRIRAGSLLAPAGATLRAAFGRLSRSARLDATARSSPFR